MTSPNIPLSHRVLLLLLSIVLAGCGSLPNEHGWGANATLNPGWERIGNAARKSALSPHVWIPTGAALLLQIDHADERISDWATENTPIFGSNQKAEDASNILLYSSVALFGITALATPSGDKPQEWMHAKAKGIGVQSLAPLFTLGTTELLKFTINRSRPNGEDQKSFPSGHTSVVAANSMLSYQNTETLQIPQWEKVTLKTGFIALPYATGWARIEAAKHYPSDILIGTALGNFFGAFINDAFMNVESAEDLQVTFRYLPDGTFAFGLTRQF
jgi:hypothetical protein